MLLDFTATFFASSTTLLPIFATEILGVGEKGYGFLASAPSLGAVLTGALMSTFPTIDRQGRVLFTAVVGYGLATVLFGLSSFYWLSFAALFLIGATDTISTVLRHTILQLATPDELRGRMTSVNMIFILGGPRLGEAEAGLVAGLVSAPFSVISGGIGCVIAVLYLAARSTTLREYRQRGEPFTA
jgi:MFS family permease